MNAELSVVIPSFNGAPFLVPLLEQVRAAAPSCEIILVDDGSTDETEMIARDFENDVRYLRQSNRGPAAARNHGLRHSSASFASFLDVDDQWAPAHPGAALEVLKSGGWDVILGKTQCLTRASASSGFVEHEAPFHTFNLGSAIIRRDVFARVGLFNEALSFGEDLDWFLRAREQGVRMALFDRPTLLYRLHEANLIGQAGSARGGMLNALRLSIARRRENESALTALPVVS